jgi:hypothetical protein
MNNAYIYAQIHQGHLIGITTGETGFTFDIFLPDSVERADVQYHDVTTALNAAIKQVESDSQWLAGFQSYERGEPLPEIANFDFICGWHDGQQAYGRAA